MLIELDANTSWSDRDPWVPEFATTRATAEQLLSIGQAIGPELVFQVVPQGIRLLVTISATGDVQYLTPGGNPLRRHVLLQAAQRLTTELTGLAKGADPDGADLILDGILSVESGTYTVHDLIFGQSDASVTPWVTPMSHTARRLNALTVIEAEGGFLANSRVTLARTALIPSPEVLRGEITRAVALGHDILIKAYTAPVIVPGVSITSPQATARPTVLQVLLDGSSWGG